MFDSQSPIKSDCFGIFPSSLVLKTAIEAAIEDLRAKPWLLKYCFNYLKLDPLSNKYQNSIDEAIKWFLTHNIPVFLDIRTDDVKMPCISISLMNSSEAEETLADINYQPIEDSDIDWPNLVGPFTATYEISTGDITLPDSAAEQIVLSAGQLIVDKLGRTFEILEVLDFSSVRISTNQVIDLSENVYIRGQKPAYQVHLEGKNYRETYQLGCFVSSEATHLNYLYMVLIFILNVYKQSLLEKRGLERTSISASDFIKNPLFETEIVYSRHITLTGYVRQMWPKYILPKITAIANQVRIGGTTHLFPPDVSPSQLWIGEDDVLGTGKFVPMNTAPSQSNSTGDGGGSPLIYWGSAATPGAIDQTFVKSLSYNIAAQSKAGIYNYNAGANQYVWFAYPVSMGGTIDDFSDNATGFPFGGSFVATISITNLYNITQSYYVFRSDYPNLGQVVLEVS